MVVTELSTRLKKEIEEREAEAALYNAKLYESEKQQGDWYVEKRLLEKRIEELDREVRWPFPSAPTVVPTSHIPDNSSSTALLN